MRESEREREGERERRGLYSLEVTSQHAGGLTSLVSGSNSRNSKSNLRKEGGLSGTRARSERVPGEAGGTRTEGGHESHLEKELSGLLFAHIMHTGVKQEDAMLAATEPALVGVKRTRWVPLVLKLAVAGERRHGGLAVDVARRLVETPLGRARTLQELRVSVSGPPVRRLGVDQVDQGNQLRTVERKCSRQGIVRRNKGVLGLTASGLSTTWAKGAGRRCEVPLSSAPLPPPKLAARLLPLRETSRERALMSSMKVLIVGTCVALSSYPP